MDDIAELIASKLRDGIEHPGDSSKNLPPKMIALPFKPSPGMPQEMADLMTETTKLLAEAIVYTIETEGGVELVPRTEAVEMRRAVGEGPPHPMALPVFCRCGEMLVALSHPVNDVISVDGQALIKGLSKREAKCPHREVK